MFKFSQHLSVNNAFAVRGLKILAELASVLGEGARALQYSNQATALLGKMKQLMWNQTLPGFCDGVCTEVDGLKAIVVRAEEWLDIRQIRIVSDIRDLSQHVLARAEASIRQLWTGWHPSEHL